jgi:hypothetical protein
MIQTNLKLDMVRKMQNDSEKLGTHPSVELPDTGHYHNPPNEMG